MSPRIERIGESRIGDLTIIVVAHTFREDSGEEVVRVISARKATSRERRVYEENE
jgi:uncharacterized DUF497 family protein